MWANASDKIIEPAGGAKIRDGEGYCSQLYDDDETATTRDETLQILDMEVRPPHLFLFIFYFYNSTMKS